MNIAPSLTGSVVICNFSRIRLAASSSDRHTSLSRPLPPRICRRVPRSDKIPEPHFAGRIAISKNSPLPLPSPPLYPFFIYTLTGVASTKWIYASYRVTRETTLLLDGPMQICLDAKNSSDTERSICIARSYRNHFLARIIVTVTVTLLMTRVLTLERLLNACGLNSFGVFLKIMICFQGFFVIILCLVCGN